MAEGALRLRGRLLLLRRRPGRASWTASRRARARSAPIGVVVEDLRLPFLRDFCFPALRAGAIYEGRYLLGTSLARPLIAARQVRCARAHAAPTRSRTAAPARATTRCASSSPTWRWRRELAVIAPWREWDIVSREDALAYAEAPRHPGAADHERPLLARRQPLAPEPRGRPARGSGEPRRPRACSGSPPSPEPRPAQPEQVTIGFEGGKPGEPRRRGARSGRAGRPQLNALAGKHGVGRADLVESRLVGMKSRGVYETPGRHRAARGARGPVPAHAAARRAAHARRARRRAWRTSIYAGLWFTPLRRVAAGVRRHGARSPRRGEVTVELFHGRATRSRARARSRSTARISRRST